jgi:hypothetical protein
LGASTWASSAFRPPAASLQQFVHQQQQLALEFRVVPLAPGDLLELDQQLGQHVLRVAQHQGAKGGADDDEHLDGCQMAPTVPPIRRSRRTRRRAR